MGVYFDYFLRYEKNNKILSLFSKKGGVVLANYALTVTVMQVCVCEGECV
jgi:hypothetical protein